MNILEEIEYIRSEYRKGNKKVQPSFKYIIFIFDSSGRHDSDFDIAADLSEAEEKALSYISLTDDWVEIYKVKQNGDNEYVAVCEKAKMKELEDFQDEILPDLFVMHISWKIRGKYLGEKQNV